MAIIGNINEVTRQAAGTEALNKGLAFLADVLNGKLPDVTARAKKLNEGENFEVPIHGKDVFANFQAYKARQRKDGFFEAHKEFTDIQCLLEGEEWIETCMLMEHGSAPVYDENNNFFFPLSDKPVTRFHMKPGLTVILHPQDAHAPCLSSTETPTLVRKVVVKVKNAQPA
jgi:biofilm protein TabA